ncbi:MAG: amidohydrolase [Acidimicrobiia bacterium]|nr:amidohydrolase [Acidimicrobiia bacterium]
MRFDLVLDNADILTIDPDRPRAGSIAILGERIVAVGERGEFAAHDALARVDLDGRFVVPGFNDAHNHMPAFGATLTEVPLHAGAVRSIEELIAAIGVRARALPAGTWIVGAGYDHNKLAERRHPTCHELDRVSAEHPVLLNHTSGHFATLNSAAMRLARIGEVDVPTGGVVAVDEDGHPNGLLEEQAQQLVRSLLHPRSTSAMVANLEAADKHYLSEGLTSCQEAGVGGILGTAEPLELAAYQQARREERLRVRVTLMVSVDAVHDVDHHADDPEAFALDLGLHSGFGDDRLRIGATKIFADGSLIGRTAAMFDDYAGEPGNNGYFQMPEERLHRLILAAHRSGWQVATHAIGDRAVSSVLDAYDEALRRHPRKDHRHRIEHCGVCRPEDVARIARLGVIPVPQARFVSEIGDGMLDALGASRTTDCYRERSFLDAGITLPGSSDRPVVNGAPLLGIHDLVNQRTASGRPFNPQEALTVEQAVGAYTLGSATAAFDEHRKGSIQAGKLADLVVLDHDLTAIEPDGIAETTVLATMVGGHFEFDAAGLASAAP